jgi:hypothetical protein
VTPEEAAAKIEEQRQAAGITEPKNLEEQAISLVGKDIFEKLVKGYTEKQWGRDCKDLPAFIIKRLPVRLTFDNNYFNALYQGIPIGGYTKLVEHLLEGIEVRLNTVWQFVHREFQVNIGKSVILAYFHSSGAVGSVIHHQYFAALRQQGADAGINIDGAGSTEQDAGILFQVSMHNFYKVFSEPLHQSAEFFLSGTDVRHDLCVFYGISGGRRSGIQ